MVRLAPLRELTLGKGIANLHQTTFHINNRHLAGCSPQIVRLLRKQTT